MRTATHLVASIMTLLALTAGQAHAQIMRTTYRSIEAKVAEAENVVLGPITKVSLNVIVAQGAREKDGYYADDNGRSEYTLTVKINETLKGNLTGSVADLRTGENVGFDRRYEEWAKAETAILWFLGPTPKAGEQRGWTLLPLGKPVPAEDYFGGRSEPPMFSMDFTILKDEKEILARARAFARTSAKTLPIHAMQIPSVVARSGGSWNTLLVPVEPTLQERAKRLIASPQDFVPAGKKLDALTRYQLRFAGVNSLHYFKSEANAALLRSLLDEPAEALKGEMGEQYPIPTRAFEILLGWDMDTSLPKAADKITSLDLAGTQVTDGGLKRLIGLKNLARLDLQDTKITDTGLKELAGLRKLKRLRLGETQVTDANLRALREIDLLHALPQASATGGKRPKSAADVVTLELYRSPVTDAGLKELAGLKNLAGLYLNDSKVTGVGLKELAGLKNLTTLHLPHAPVTDEGLRELARLKSIANLALDHTKVTAAGLKELAGLGNLANLDLSATAVHGAGLKELAGLKNLARLALGGDQITDASLRALREIDRLHLLAYAHGDKRPKSADEVTSFGFLDAQVTDAGLKELAGFKNLEELHLHTSKITGTGLKDLAGLARLTEVSVRNTPLTDAGMRELAGLPSLRTLHMHGPDVTDARLRVLREGGKLYLLYDAGSRINFPPSTMPPRPTSDDAVRWLDLSYTDVGDAGMKEVAGLKNLASLHLAGTAVTGAGLMELARLKNLSRLSVGGPQTTEATLKELGRFKDLTRLTLRYAPVSNAVLKELAALKNLTSLRLYGTTATDAGIAELQKMLPGCKIDR